MLPSVSQTRPSPVLTPELLDALKTRYLEAWRHASPIYVAPPKTSRLRQLRCRGAISRLVSQLAGEIEALPADEGEQALWRRRVQTRLRTFGRRWLDWPDEYGSLLVGDDFYGASIDFLGAARDFATQLEPADQFQALRNVWIANSLQLLTGARLETSDSIFAYSMLYPLTDNYLDDPRVTAQDKRRFQACFGRRLAGESVRPATDREARIYSLVGRIEAQFPRVEFPDVYSSLLAIHDAQGLSLRQHDPATRSAEALDISIRKGGSSVLPDGLLAAGRMSSDELAFCFGYGVFLQLLDDLQDVASDLAAGHRTVFSLGAESGPLDDQASRLLNLMQSTLASRTVFLGPEHEDVIGLIGRNCHALWVGAIAEVPALFTPRFLRAVGRSWPIRLRVTPRILRDSKRKLSRAVDSLRQQRGAASVLDLL